ncbi:hypothetical protein G647_00195 [Cladophialophora carrionii CBS 160.54]|uniref:AMP-dependent synthetase/ligase domain-containing protein n=1 Tax=Cladophialophora carrionii CBS 160.54 TaxID=1279043 RepID=V9DM55_9EURO|nr:uncharacterized protein G647_00195 [Cladophialophora carrionii CBS 160.54]ETI27746.1 hypothetical protein G647_00195 [Cladophialophora carrionii CBS 160.54]
MTVEDEEGRSFISDQETSWDTAWDEEIANRTAVMVFSSGTTGSPKGWLHLSTGGRGWRFELPKLPSGVCISQRNIISMILQLRHLFRSIRSGKKVLKMAGILDSAHVAGLFLHSFSPLGVGVEDILVPATDIDLLLQTYNRHPIELMFCVPTVLTRLLAHDNFRRTDFKNLKYITTGAAKTTPVVQQEITRALTPGVYCQEAWGMMELTFLATMHVPGVLGPWNSVGKPLCGNVIQIRDDQGKVVPVGQTGEIWVSSPTVTPEYYLAQVNDHDAKKDEWLRTGDLGSVDQAGYVYVEGRNKDLVKYNGAQISPHELEGVAREHDAVLDVGVVGLDLEDGNELPTAFVVLKPGSPLAANSEEILSFVNSRLSPYKRLRGGVHVLQELPKNAMGKLSYRDLRELAKKLHKTPRTARSKL